MSVIIKSNKVSSNNFGQSAMIGRTPASAFAEYKARVLADGGVVKSEARTLAAFTLLFESKMFGLMNTFVSGTFGVKTNGSGGITKLYAIDGDDMLGATYGSGTLPTLTAGNDITFAANAGVSDNTNGGMFSTATKKVLSKSGRFGLGVRVMDVGTDTSGHTLSALSLHSDIANTQPIAQLIVTKPNNTVALQCQINPLKLNTLNLAADSIMGIVGQNNPMLSWIKIAETNSVVGSRNGSQTTSATASMFAEIATQDFYIDFGGVYRSDKKYFTKATIRDFFSFKHATSEQSTALSAFIA